MPARGVLVQGSVGPPLLADAALHSFLSREVPQAALSTYMDDWKATARCPDTVVLPIQTAERFATLWDITIDHAKTIAWSTDKSSRKTLSAAGYPVTMSAARDLGGQTSATTARTNSVLTARIASLDEVWPRLICSPAGYGAKIMALKVAAWPKALYGSSNTQVGRQHFQRLRTGALQGLHCRKPGANPLLHLSMVEFSLADPGFFVLRQSFLDLLRYGSVESFAPVAQELLQGTSELETGQVAVLLARCHEIGIVWDTAISMFRDAFGPLCAFTVAPQELEARLVRGWQSSVSQQVARRPGFEGLDRADAQLTKRLAAEFPADDQALLRVSLNGTFFTEDALHHIGESDLPACPCCGQRDSVSHRVWHCRALEGARSRAMQGFPVEPTLLPSCLSLHARALRPESQDAVHRCLLDICEPRPPFLNMPATNEICDLYTDGSCLFPHVPCLRLASWAVTAAQPEGGSAKIVAVGLLPGLVQTAFRSEIVAVLCALQAGIRSGCRVRIWSDCLGVVRRVNGFLQNLRVSPTSRNADLWFRVKNALEDIGDNFLGPHKVSAHMNYLEAEDEVTRWQYFNNQLVDQAACRANLDRPIAFWDQWEQLRRQWTYHCLVAKQVMRVHVAVGRAVRDWKRPSVPGTIRQPDPLVPVMDIPTCSEDRLRDVYRKFGRPFTQTLLTWLRLVVHSGRSTEARWISYVQLYIAFMEATSFRPPFCRTSSKQWYCVGNDPVLLLREVELSRRVTCFQQQIKECVRAAGGVLSSMAIRPASEFLQVRLHSVFLNLPASTFLSTEEALSKALQHPCHDGRWKTMAF